MQANNLVQFSRKPELPDTHMHAISLEEFERILANVEHEIQRMEAFMTACQLVRRHKGNDS
jgi:hypothetical protein